MTATEPFAAAHEGSSEAVRLLDDQTFETVGVHRLAQHEMACSVNSVTFKDDPSEYYVVGTAYVLPDEMEPCKVRS